MKARGDALVVGRDLARSAVAEFLEHAHHEPQTLVLEGEAGIGKSVLWHEAVQSTSLTVLACAPTSAESALPFAALADLLRTVPEATLSTLPEAQRTALDVALCRTQPGPDGLHALAVSHGLLTTLRALAAVAPVLVAVDDLQWVDAATAEALVFSLRRVEEPVSLLATRRSQAPQTTRAWDDVALETLLLDPLDLDDLDLLLEARLGRAFRLPALLEIARSSGGNPLHALEVARAALAAGVELSPGSGLPVAPDLASLLRARVDQLPSGVPATLVLAAALAHPTVPLLGEALRDPDLAAAYVAAAEQAGIVVRTGDRLRLFHPLCGAALLSRLDAASRREVHARLAQVAPDEVERARHLALATPCADVAVAEAVEQGALVAGARGAPVEAADLAEHALRLTPHGDFSARAVRAVRAALHHEQAGTASAALPLLETVLDELAPGPRRVPVLLRLASVRNACTDAAGARRTYEQAVSEAGEDVNAAAEARQALAWELAATGNVVAAREHARTCSALAERVTAPQLADGCRAISALVEFMAGNGQPSTLVAGAVEPIGYTWPFPDATDPAWAAGVAAVWADDADSARGHAARMRRHARRTGDPVTALEADWVDAHADYRSGRWTAAAAYARAEVASATRFDERDSASGMDLWFLSLVEAGLGEVERARAHAALGVEQARASGQAFAELHCQGVLGFLALSRGEYAEAWRVLAPLPAALASMGYGDPAFLRCTADAIEAGVAVDALEEAKRLLAVFEEQAERSGSRWGAAAATRCRGLLLAAHGEVASATDVLEHAIALAEPLHEPFELARTLLVAGGVARRRKLKADAGALLRRAEELFSGLPAPLWAARAQDEGSRLGGRPSSPFALTATERQVAELAASGMSNAEVAAALFVTVKTVEWNLSKVYRKTGLRSRAELAAQWPLVAEGVKPGVLPGSPERPRP